MLNVVKYQWGLSPSNPFDLDYQHFEKPADYPVLDLHQSLHLILVLDGVLEGKINSVAFSASAGRLLLTAPWELHGNNHVTDHLSLLSLTVDPNTLVGNLIAFQDKAWTLLTMPTRERIQILNTPPVRKLVLKWGKVLLKRLGGRPELVKMKQWLAIQSFFAELLDLLTDEELPDTPGEHYQRLLPALQLLSQRPTVTVSEAARACSLSVSRFSHLFQETCHLGFAAYELRNRLNRAALALQRGQMVKTVAAQEGFYDASHFSKHFFRHFGLQPREWAKTSRPAEFQP